MSIEKDLADVINIHGYDVKLGVPDYILAKHLLNKLESYVAKKEKPKPEKELMTNTNNHNPTETSRPVILHGVPSTLNVSAK